MDFGSTAYPFWEVFPTQMILILGDINACDAMGHHIMISVAGESAGHAIQKTASIHEDFPLRVFVGYDSQFAT